MAKLVKQKKASNAKETKTTASKTRAAKNSKKVVDLEKSDNDDDNESEDQQEIPTENGHNENRSTLLDDCEKAFGTHDLYKILDVVKGKATPNDSEYFFD